MLTECARDLENRARRREAFIGRPEQVRFQQVQVAITGQRVKHSVSANQLDLLPLEAREELHRERRTLALPEVAHTRPPARERFERFGLIGRGEKPTKLSLEFRPRQHATFDDKLHGSGIPPCVPFVEKNVEGATPATIRAPLDVASMAAWAPREGRQSWAGEARRKHRTPPGSPQWYSGWRPAKILVCLGHTSSTKRQ